MLPKIRTPSARVVILGVVLAFLVMVLALQTRRVVPVETVETARVRTAIPETYTPENVSFAVRVKGDVIPYGVMGLYVMPGQTVEVAGVSAKGAPLALDAEAGDLETPDAGTWHWTAPQEPGHYPLTVWDRRSGEAVRLNAFVMVPFGHTEEVIGDFRIGQYQQEPLRGNPAYERPTGFIQVTEENQDVLVSPHFTLGQFVSKQSTDFPKYVVLQERLLMKLERILEAVNARGIPANRFHVMSAFRTPFYNASIGNETEYSMHLYGGAADIFIDMDGDGSMDDLNRDGQVTRADAEFLAGIVEDLRDDPAFEGLEGGLGIYDANPSHGPFVHVDVRGRVVEW